MRKLVSVLLTLAVAVSLMVMPAVTSAAGTPTIDGVISTGEWDDYFWFTDNTGFGAWDALGWPTQETNVGRTFNAYATNDNENLYLAFDVIDDLTNLKGDSLNVNFNVGDLSKIDAGDCSLETNWIGVAGKDIMWGACTGDGWETRVRTFKAQEGTTSSGGCTFDNGAEIRWGFTDHRMYEVAIPLELLGVGPGAQIGIVGNIYDGYGSTESPGLLWNEFPDDFSWEDTSTYMYVFVQANTAVGLTAETSNITAISVTPTSINFGAVIRGTLTSGDNITVENIGGVKVVVDAFLNPTTGTVFNYLKLNGAYSPSYNGYWDNIISSMSPSVNQTFTTALVVPLTYSGKGTETGLLVFEATAV